MNEENEKAPKATMAAMLPRMTVITCGPPNKSEPNPASKPPNGDKPAFKLTTAQSLFHAGYQV